MNTTLSSTQPPDLLKMLAHEIRWQIVAALSYSDRRVYELGELVGRPINLVSYHLRQLWQSGLVQERRSTADARDVYYSVDLEKLRQLYYAAGEALHPSFGAMDEDDASETSEEQFSPARILFLCTHNSARSQMSEAIARNCGKGRIEAFSAGTEPAEVNPFAVRVIEALGQESAQHRSKHLDEFLGQSFDYVITVCDRARESCLVFPGDPERIHWSFPGPAAVEGTDLEKQRVFNDTARQLQNRINHLLVLIDRRQRAQKRGRLQ